MPLAGVRCKPQVGVCCGAVVTRVALGLRERETHVARTIDCWPTWFGSRWGNKQLQSST